MARLNIDLIRDFIKYNDLSVSEFCKMCKINKATYYKLIKGECDCRFDTALKIVDTLGVSLDLFLGIKKATHR